MTKELALYTANLVSQLKSFETFTDDLVLRIYIHQHAEDLPAIGMLHIGF